MTAKLQQRHILELLREHGASWGVPLHVRERTASTNDDARRGGQAGEPDGALHLADAQDAGRGRGRHQWHSPAGSNIYMSLLLRPRVAPARLSSLTLAVGVAVADLVDEVLGRPTARIKWPNDVLIGQRKVAGILVESSIRAGSDGPQISLVVGVGVNVHTAEFPPALAEIATSLHLAGAVATNRNTLIARLVFLIEQRVKVFFRHGLAPLLADFRKRDALVGKAIRIGEVAGRCAGIDEEGQLLVDAPGGRLALRSGEVDGSWRTAD